MKPIVALDFDGVICDSIDECMLTAFNAYHAFQGHPKWFDNLSKINPEFSERFRLSRHLVRPAKEYWLLVHLMFNYDDYVDQSQFDIFKKQYSEILVKFEPVFYATRHRLRLGNLAGWSDLHRIYPEFLQGWEKVRNRSSVHLVTDKDLWSVEYFIELWGLDIHRASLWTKEKQLSKASAIEQIAQQTRCPTRKILFVDDNPYYLNEVSKTGAFCFWASWGYSNFETVRNVGELKHLASLSELPI